MGGVTTGSAQGILDRTKEDAQRRAENKAVMDAENPQDAETGTAPGADARSTTTATSASCVVPARTLNPGHASAGAVRICQERLPKACLEIGQAFTFFQC